MLSNNLAYAYVVASLFYTQAKDYILSLLYLKALAVDEDESLALNKRIIEEMQNEETRSVFKSNLEVEIDN